MRAGEFKFSKSSLKKLSSVDPGLEQVMRLALQISHVDFGIAEGFRTEKKQRALFKKNNAYKTYTMCDGYIKKSRHQYGEAVDIYCWVDGKISYDHAHLYIAAAAILQAASELGVSVKWSGFWDNTFEYVHFELIK